MNALGYTLADHNMDLGRAEGLIHKRADCNARQSRRARQPRLGAVSQGDAKGAVPQLEHAYSLEHDADIAAHWGEVLWASGKHQDARRVWAAAIARAPDAPLLKATMARFLKDAS